MSDDIVEVPVQSSAPSTNANNSKLQGRKDPEDLMDQFSLREMLADVRARKVRTTFMSYIPEIPTDKVPLKPKCPAGSLMEIALQPVNEDERVIEPFDERVVRAALTLKEADEKIAMPDWLSIEQTWNGEDERRKRRKDKKKKKKKKKRKRDRDGEDGGDDDERRRKKRK